MSRLLRIEHLARVEGHGGITVELDGAAVRRVQFDVFEGLRLLEGLVRGRRFDELPGIVSRICSICSAVHAVAAIGAVEAAFGVVPSAQTSRLRDLLLLGENVESHALHLFLLAAPDYLGYPGAAAMAADLPDAVRLGLRLKQLGNRIQEVVGGRAIHPFNAVVGGFGRVPSEEELHELATALEGAGRDGELAVELIAALPPADCGRSPMALAALSPRDGYGYRGGAEVVTLRGAERSRVPAGSFRAAIDERSLAHSHARHSTWDGAPFMVGALARVTLFGERLGGRGRAARAALAGRLAADDPLANNAAQAVELVQDLETCRGTVGALLAEGLRPEPPVAATPREGRGTAVLEAPRGLLVHRYAFDADGRVAAADVVTPTALNAASLERRLRRLVERDGAAADEVLRPRLEMLARAYDPCISCSVHLVRRR